MEVLFKFIWIVFIGLTFVNVYILRSRVAPYIEKNPDLESGYDLIFRKILLYGNIPWVIIGIGVLSGNASTVFDIFSPSTLNPVALAFHMYILFLYAFAIVWIYFKDGAEFLSKHPGIIRFRGFGQQRDITSVTTIKIFFAIALCGGISGMITMWFTPIRIH